jgi:hypothetical protein
VLFYLLFREILGVSPWGKLCTASAQGGAQSATHNIDKTAVSVVVTLSKIIVDEILF